MIGSHPAPRPQRGDVQTVRMHDLVRLRALLSEYDGLQSQGTGALTPQVRGARFNELLGDMLELWGIPVRTSTATSGTGEIDVSFTLSGLRFIVEAKWEKTRTNADPIGKLSMRLRQRLRGTIGVFVSMAGYTPDALAAPNSSGERSMLLLDRMHVEAMLTGMVPPDELFELALEQAAYTGQWYVPLLALLAPHRAKPPVVFDGLPDLETVPLADGVTVHAVGTIHRAEQLGMVAEGSSLLITHPDGIISISQKKNQVAWRAPIRGTHGAPIPLPDGTLVFARRHAVATLAGAEINILEGGFSDRCSLFAGPGDTVWVLDPIHAAGTQTTSAVVRLGTRVGEKQRYEISTPHPWPVGAFWLSETSIMLIHDSSCSVVRLDSGLVGQLRLASHGCIGLIPLDDETLMSVGGQADFDLNNVAIGRSAHLGTITGRPTIRGVAKGKENRIFAAVGIDANSTAIAAIEFQTAVPEIIERAFIRADSGDLAGYRAEVARLAHRQVVPTNQTKEQLQASYNDILQRVHENLVEPLQAQAEAAGMQPMGMTSRSIDGGWPPGYGGSASSPRWRLDDRGEIWLEAWVGVSHRGWPDENLNDLVITFMMAIMTDLSQRTLLTRFEPINAGESRIDTVIAELKTQAFRATAEAVTILSDR